MNALSRVHTDTGDLAVPPSIRELTADEVEEVAGGALPILVIAAAVVVATVLQESGEESQSEGEEAGGPGGGEDTGDN